MIPYGKQHINQADVDAVLEVLGSDFLTQGPKVPEFEQGIADYCGANYAVAVNSATSALHIACLALGIGEGDVVWTSPISFVASANCVLYCGAEIDFVDIDSNTYNLSVSELEKKLIQANKNGELPKAVIAVHMSGLSCDMEAISQLADQYGFAVIEDASHAIGASYHGRKVGDCQFSDMAIFSFHPVKIITSAEGGMVTTNDPKLAEQLQLFRSHGVTRDEELMTEESHGAWYYQQITLGYNYRMSDIQGALGLSQLQRLDEFVEARNDLSLRYDKALSGLPIKLPLIDDERISARHLYIIRLRLSELNKTHPEVFDQLRANGVGVNLHYIPIHIQPYYRKLGFKVGQFPEAELYYQDAISIPLYAHMTESEQDEVIAKIVAVLQP